MIEHYNGIFSERHKCYKPNDVSYEKRDTNHIYRP